MPRSKPKSRAQHKADVHWGASQLLDKLMDDFEWEEMEDKPPGEGYVGYKGVTPDEKLVIVVCGNGERATAGMTHMDSPDVELLSDEAAMRAYRAAVKQCGN